MMQEAIEGHCLCGTVRITLSAPKRHVEICHCDMCRRWGGAFFVGLDGETFTIDGEDAVRTYNASAWGERAFCGNCGSNLWYRFLPTGSRSFLAGLFADADNYPVEKEIFVDEQARWCDLSGDHPRLTGAEEIAAAEAAGFTFD